MKRNSISGKAYCQWYNSDLILQVALCTPDLGHNRKAQIKIVCQIIILLMVWKTILRTKNPLVSGRVFYYNEACLNFLKTG